MQINSDKSNSAMVYKVFFNNEYSGQKITL